MDSGAPVAELLAGLSAVLDDAERLALSCQPPEDVREWACGLQSVRARVEAMVCRALVAVGTSGVVEADGQRSVAAVIAAHTGANPKAVAGDVGLGVWLGRFPVIEAAFAAGRLSRRHVEALRRLENPRTRDHLVEAQDYLVTAAEGCSWHEFGQVLRYWELAFDPDGVEPDEHARSRSCRATKNPDGTVSGDFHLDPIAGQAFLTALDQEVGRLFREEAESEVGIVRSATQRRHDALINLVCRGAARPDGTIPAPLVHIVLGEQVVEDLLQREPGDPEPLPLDPSDVDHRCELIDGTPVHPRAALALLALASFRRQVLRAPSETRDLGRTVRSFPPALKAALLVAARGRCQHWGCDAPVVRLQADHIQPWNRHGPTALHNGQILCDTHNGTKRDRPPP